jgi:YbbR domain-containing protein
MRINLNDILLGLASLVLALLLWFAVAGQKSAEVSVAAPIELRNMPPGLELVGEIPRTLEIWLRGSPGLVQRLRPAEVYVALDMTGAEPGRRVVHVTTADVRVPYGVRIASVRPASFALEIERTTQKVVPIQPMVRGLPARGYHVASVTCEPAEVTIAGPESLAAALIAAPTEPLSVEATEMNVVREVSLQPPAAPLRLLNPQPVRVTVRLSPEPGRN